MKWLRERERIKKERYFEKMIEMETEKTGDVEGKNERTVALERSIPATMNHPVQSMPGPRTSQNRVKNSHFKEALKIACRRD